MRFPAYVIEYVDQFGRLRTARTCDIDAWLNHNKHRMALVTLIN